jgi:aryl-alcohol dehydrogenase-like predicted oxidoreductase
MFNFFPACTDINLQRDSHLTSRSVDGMQQQANAVMDELFQQSRSLVPWLDCARSYGLSEKFVGEYLRSNNVSPSDVFVSSKWGYTYVAVGEGEPHEVKDHSLENFLKQVEETSENIGEYVKLYQVHSATFDSGILTNTKVHEALNKCREEKGWKIGLSVSGPSQDELIREAMQIKVASQQRLFDSVQVTYNILEQRPHDALIEAHKAGLDIIIKEGLANGRVLSNPTLLELSSTLNCQPDQLALAAILAQSFRPRVLSGSVSADQLRSNLGSFYSIEDSESMSVAERLVSTTEGQGVLQKLMESCRMESDKYWGDRSALKWN